MWDDFHWISAWPFRNGVNSWQKCWMVPSLVCRACKEENIFISSTLRKALLQKGPRYEGNKDAHAPVPYCRHTAELCRTSAWCRELTPSYRLHHEAAAASFAALIARSKGMPLSEHNPLRFFARCVSRSALPVFGFRYRFARSSSEYTSPPPDYPSARKRSTSSLQMARASGMWRRQPGKQRTV